MKIDEWGKWRQNPECKQWILAGYIYEASRSNTNDLFSKIEKLESYKKRKLEKGLESTFKKFKEKYKN